MGEDGDEADQGGRARRLRFYRGSDPVGRQGFREIDVGPENMNDAAFLPVPNFGLGYDESKQIETVEARLQAGLEPALMSRLTCSSTLWMAGLQSRGPSSSSRTEVPAASDSRPATVD